MHSYDGNRLQKSNGKIYWYGAGTEILDESDASGNFTNEYVFFGGKRIAMSNVSTGTIYYYAEDMLGSSRTIVQAGQTSVCYDADFYPFGGERDIVSTCSQNYKFQGKERDTETNNDDFGARYDASSLARFMTPDWSAQPEDIPYAKLGNPQSLNLYAYAQNNPVSDVDPDGHDPAVNGTAEGPAPPQTDLQCHGQDCLAVAQGIQCKEDPTGCATAKEKEEQTAQPQANQQPPAPKPPAPPPDATKKTEFPTEAAAAKTALDRVNKTSISEDKEYAGWVEPNGNGTWSIDHANPGTQAGSDPGPKPSPNASDYHTHGGNDRGFDNEHFSPRDKENVPHAKNRYLETPSGAIKKLDPSTGKVTTLRKGTQ